MPGAVMPALVHLAVTSVKCYGWLKGRDGRMRKDTRQEANYNNLSGAVEAPMNDGSVFLVVKRKSVLARARAPEREREGESR